MKAVLCESFGPAENLTLADIEAPQLLPGHVIVEIRACADFPDVLMIEGKYQSLPPHLHPVEFAGVVSEVADDVENWQLGDEVFGACGHGAMASILCICKSLRQPQSMGFAQASGISTTYGTSYYALKQRANSKRETLLVLGARRVGLAAVELGKAMGARVIAAASSPEKLLIPSAGAVT